MENFIKVIEEALRKILPQGITLGIEERKGLYENYYKIFWHVRSKGTINNVSGQYPFIASLYLNPEKMELYPQIFGGNGGNIIYRAIDKNNPKEKYNALGTEKIPFRKPKNTEEAVLKAITVFAARYLIVLKDIGERGLVPSYYLENGVTNETLKNI